MIKNENSNSNRKLRIFVILGLMVLIVVAGCVNKENKENGTNAGTYVNTTPRTTAEQSTETTPTQQGISEPGISSSTGGMMERYNLDRLISMSDSIIIAEVVSVLPSRWNTQTGEKPVDNGNNLSSTIYTDTNVKIIESLKGSLGDTTITIRILGGIVGQDKQYVEDQPSYSVNEKVLIFLKNDSDPRTKDIGNNHFITTGLMQGKISIPASNELIIGDGKMSLDEARTIITGKGEKTNGGI